MTEFSPREFLKRRRPERFSDSVGIDTPVLDRGLLEYHVETLTNRGEEQPFETFARRLAERTICPNLLPHTGPSGGGDSKVDSETYPVSEAIALTWFVGTGTLSATERWAFAFSAKRDWRPKLKSDIAKIVATDRQYSKAFFVSSQYIPDKARAAAEDDLRKAYGIDVRILDRTWILDRVFTDRLEELAIQELGINTSVRREIAKGPRDTQREHDLKAVELRINDAVQRGAHTPALVEACLEAATLARSLERTRVEVDGLAARAERMAAQFGTDHQRVQSAYDSAWTAFWWFEDYEQFASAYSEVEQRATGTRNPYDLELWTNLFFILSGAVSHGRISSGTVDVNARALALKKALERVSGEQERPSAALQARTLHLMVRLLMTKPKGRDAILRDLSRVVRGAGGLVGYPLQPLVEQVTELGEVLGQSKAYEELFDLIVDTTRTRQGEIAAAEVQLTRGAQQLESGHAYDAIRMLGRALTRLYKEETRQELVQCLYLLAHAYEEVGLLWAARGTLLSAASIATNEYWTHDRVSSQQAVCYHSIKWIELTLGRLPHLLAWHEADRAVRYALSEHGYQMKRLATADEAFDATLGARVLAADLRTLADMRTLPSVLEELDLQLAGIALKYALGHEDQVPPELISLESGSSAASEVLLSNFRDWRDKVGSEDSHGPLNLCDTRTLNFSSRVLGCEVRVDCVNDSPCVEVAESILAAIEAFCATGVPDDIVAAEPTLTISVRTSDFANEPVAFVLEDRDGIPEVEVRCQSFVPHSLTPEFHETIKRKLMELTLAVLGRVFMMHNIEGRLKSMFRDDLVAHRALDFTSSLVVIGNVLGHAPKLKMSAWLQGEHVEWALTRTEDWDPFRDAGVSPANRLKPGDISADEPPAEMYDPDRITHRDLRTISLIRSALWDKAGWVGTVYATVQGPSTEPPVMALMFKNPEEGAKIFRAWRDEIGTEDSGGHLRVAIVRGVNEDNPHEYRVVIGTGEGRIPTEAKQFMSTARINLMTPDTDANLERFLDAFSRAGKFVLTWASSGPGEPSVAYGHGIVESRLSVRYAWEVGPHDLDVLAIKESDHPVIPAGVRDPPARRSLVRSRERSRRKRKARL